MFNWKLRYKFIKLNCNHSNCLTLRPTEISDLVGGGESDAGGRILPLALFKTAGAW